MKQIAKQTRTNVVEGLFLPVRGESARRACRALIAYLQLDCRMSLAEISRKTGIPVSTLHDNLERLRKFYDFGLMIRPKHPRLG